MERLAGYIRESGLKYYVITYGCQMNEHESEKVKGMLEEMGYRPAAAKKEADIILFNTCCVRENAELKTFGNVGALKQQKQENKNLIIGILGCMTQQEEVAKKLSGTFPFVDIVIGTHNIAALPTLISECFAGKKRIVEVLPPMQDVTEGLPAVREAPPLCSVNIMQGCNNYCSYCIVPYVRGPEKSRGAETIIGEIADLAKRGYKEVMLLGQNVNSYSGSNMDFAALLKHIAAETDIARIRFMTSHPKDLSDALIETIANESKVCKHLHLPVQSGSSSILSRMNRGYTREHYLALVKKLRTALPDITLTTDIIVGFPGESEADFEQTMSLIETVRFDAAFTFIYSPRTGTKAAKMPDALPDEQKTERILKLIGLQNAITEEKNKAYEGKVERVLIENTSARDTAHICGRTDGGKMVNFAGENSLIGEFVDVKITEGKKTTLFGEMLEG